MSAPASIGRRASRLNAPVLGSNSSSRWRVERFAPGRLAHPLGRAARGRGEPHREPGAFEDRRASPGQSSVLPTPGPPVTTSIGDAAADFTACRCSAASRHVGPGLEGADCRLGAVAGTHGRAASSPMRRDQPHLGRRTRARYERCIPPPRKRFGDHVPRGTRRRARARATACATRALPSPSRSRSSRPRAIAPLRDVRVPRVVHVVELCRMPAWIRCGESCAMPSAARDAIGRLEADAPHVDGEPVRVPRDTTCGAAARSA